MVAISVGELAEMMVALSVGQMVEIMVVLTDVWDVQSDSGMVEIMAALQIDVMD